MKLFAVIHTVGGFAREDAPNAAIAGIFTDDKIAETVRKAAGVDAKVVSVNLDEIAPGYIEFAKQVLGIDLAQIMREKTLGMKELTDSDRECLMTAEEFLADADDGFLISSDGDGYWATDKMISHVSCWADKPEWATHVCWFNK